MVRCVTLSTIRTGDCTLNETRTFEFARTLVSTKRVTENSGRRRGWRTKQRLIRQTDNCEILFRTIDYDAYYILPRSGARFPKNLETSRFSFDTGRRTTRPRLIHRAIFKTFLPSVNCARAILSAITSRPRPAIRRRDNERTVFRAGPLISTRAKTRRRQRRVPFERARRRNSPMGSH